LLKIIEKKDLEINELSNTYNKKTAMFEQHKVLIGEKDKKINELQNLCNEFESRLNSQDGLMKSYEDVLDQYKVQIMQSYKESQQMIYTLQEQKKQITLLTRKNKQLTEELQFINNEIKRYKKD
jgi:chromosome segregation ATPase